MDSTRRHFLRSLGMGAAAAVGRGAFGAEAATARPNVVFILIDDMGWTDAGCFGSTFYETPAVDRLAAEGMRFTDAYAACPVCSPTRASIMTGKYPARLHLTNWFYGNIKRKLIGPPYIHQLPLEEVTVGEAFKSAGYATCFVGKWHLGPEPFYPDKQGFDINIAGNHTGSPAGGYFAPYRNPQLPDGPKGEHLTERLSREACQFITAHKDKPFFLYLSHYTVHTPIQSKPDYTAKYKAKAAKLPASERPAFVPEGGTVAKQRQDHAVYAGMVQSMDESVGRVMATLRQHGLADNTVVVFMSDNGGLSTRAGAPTSNVPLRAGKGWLYEGGIREPMIIKWPGVAKPGSACDVPVVSTDFYPTLLEVAGLPLRADQHADGVSLVPLLKGGKSLPRPALFWHYPHYSPQGGSPGSAVRAGDWKLIEFFEDNHVELYNLRDDIGETRDLAATKPERAAELRQ
ncbi:MAG: sulfatase, partial [Candidatus Brocadiae bacterium]|nr:sulfatase [Candidatus Brocadiia bacterium]